MKRRGGKPIYIYAFILSLSSISNLYGELFPDINGYTATSLQGFTGLINTPNAQLLEKGELVFSFNNQFDEHLRGYDTSLPSTDSSDYIFGVGLLDNLEIQGRVKEQKGYARDLSAKF